ncbi:cytochrome P450 [Calycina marina]|uniref:Cytochrome P450 n=1 Tax=Calycina marina TaxID=1763456 RepID=A0A9P7Z2A1_9HELO|nr:cytochrome P450 [Calycina marina]
MALNELISTATGAGNHFLILASICPIIFLLHNWFKLRHIPGPFLAKFTNIPRLSWVWSRRAHDVHIALHKQHGDLVRMGPNMVSVGDPLEIDKIYKLREPLNKSDFYHVILPMSKGKVLPGLFATQDEGIHRMLKKPIASTYSMTNLVSFEPFVDETIEVFFGQLDRRFVEGGRACDFGTWLQYFAFDVVGELTFSSRLGFLEGGRDIDNIMLDIWNWFEYVAVVGMMPWLDYLWVKNPIISRLRPAGYSPMVSFALKRQQERLEPLYIEKEVNNKDFLSRFIAAMEKDPSIPQWALLAWTSSNILAGSDTTAIFLRTIFKNLLQNPQTLERLRAELREASQTTGLSMPVTWKESQSLPYLDACVKEAGRIHPPFGLHLERVVPLGGMNVCGEYLREGTSVGMNAWVVHRNRAVFGEDADEWRPERWLGPEEQRKKMEASLLTFGGGHRTCLGKHISLLEIYKLVPSLLQEYDLEPLSLDKTWRIENRWFVPQFGLNVKLKKAN